MEKNQQPPDSLSSARIFPQKSYYWLLGLQAYDVKKICIASQFGMVHAAQKMSGAKKSDIFYYTHLISSFGHIVAFYRSQLQNLSHTIGS